MPNEPLTPSRWRRALGIYLDFLVFSVPAGLAWWAVRGASPGDAGAPLWIEASVFGVVETAVFRWYRWLPGHWAAGIALEPAVHVDADILARQRWWTVLLGVLTTLEGAKTAVRWTVWEAPTPILGMNPGPVMGPVVSVLQGGLLVVLGLLVVRGRTRGAMIGAVVYGVIALSAMTSYDLWAEWFRASYAGNREFMGRPMQEERLEAVLPWLTPYMVISNVLIAAWMVAAARRFRRADTGEAA